MGHLLVLNILTKILGHSLLPTALLESLMVFYVYFLNNLNISDINTSILWYLSGITSANQPNTDKFRIIKIQFSLLLSVVFPSVNSASLYYYINPLKRSISKMFKEVKQIKGYYCVMGEWRAQSLCILMMNVSDERHTFHNNGKTW